MNWKTSITILLLTANAINDFKKREILLLPTISYGLFGCFILLSEKHTSFFRSLLCLLPGFFLLAVGKASNGKVGYGDGILILVLGVWTGFLECLLTLTAGLLLASIWAAAALILKIHNKKDTIPFIPFLLIGYLARIFI